MRHARRPRPFIAAAVTAALIAALVGVPVSAASAPGSVPVPSLEATRTPIRHFITLMQEGHSFDNYFGTFPGADGIPKGVCMPVSPAVPKPCVTSFHIGTRASQDLGHSRDAFNDELHGGAMTGFVAAQSSHGVTNDLAMGYYDQRDIPYYWSLARSYVLFDRFFGAAAGGSVWNHMYWVTATAGNLKTDTIPSGGWGELNTIFDRLEAKGLSWKFYVQNYDPTVTFRKLPRARRGAQVARVPLLAYGRSVDDPKLFSHIVPLSEYFDDLRNGTLPAVAYIAPSGSSEHPPGNIVSGERMVRSIVDGLTESSAWKSSAFLLSYDTWGGWYDHVAPPKVDAFGAGFRVPALLVSAFARRGMVDHTPMDSASILRFIEQNWGLAPLTSRDANANDLTTAFDFGAAPRPAELVAPAGKPPAVSHTATGPILVLYGLALLLALGLIAGTVWRSGRRRTEVVAP